VALTQPDLGVYPLRRQLISGVIGNLKSIWTCTLFIVQVTDSFDFLRIGGLRNRPRLRLRYETVSVCGLQELTYASCTDTTEALGSDVLVSLRNAAVARRTETLGEAWVLCLCVHRANCRADYYSGCFSGSASVVLSVPSLPTRKMLQAGPRLCLEAWHAFWIRRERDLFI
jgi:hypothetical protein